MLVSPAAFSRAYSGEISIQPHRIKEFAGEEYSVEIAGAGEAARGCKYELFPVRMKMIEGKVFLASYFFGQRSVEHARRGFQHPKWGDGAPPQWSIDTN